MKRSKAPSFKLPDGVQRGQLAAASNHLVSYRQGKRLTVAQINEPRGPLQEVDANTPAHTEAQYYKVLYTKRALNKKRKNKAFQDGVLEAKPDGSCSLYSEEGKVVGKGKVKGCQDMPEGADLVVGQWEVEVDARLEETAFRAGECFLNSASTSITVPADASTARTGLPTGFKHPSKGPAAAATAAAPQRRWLHDPEAPKALHLNPSTDATIVPVVVDPYICRHLRPHQREGVRFMYECVMGMRNPMQHGAVLADEMGLGKTLQVLALCWTLLKQGPQGKPVARKAIVVTPSSLTNNWAAEVRKWLGDERLRVLVLQSGADGKQQVNDFKHAALYKVMVVSYETLRKYTDQLGGSCDILVCDEGHRLKAAGGSKTMSALLALNCPRRILLTGTPLQNNLDEFFALVSFVVPGALGSMATFKTVFADPISRSRDRNASTAEISLGTERSLELNRRMNTFLLRRTSDTIAKFLPPLTSYVVFCKPTTIQVKMYTALLRSKMVAAVLRGGAEGALPAITRLRKLCNHPSLIAAEDVEQEIISDWQELASSDRNDPHLSGKMACLDALMDQILSSSNDCMVVVCSSVMTLDIIQELCERRKYTTARIDGATLPDRRQDVVNNFNLYNVGQVFLLSTRAGGAGLNLIGANRLVLFDSDWNPAADLQAMSRIWRDGQSKACIVYRLLTTGTIDEKIYQRQLMKGQLAGVLTANACSKQAKGGGFTRDELRELFRLEADTACNTADLLNSTDFKDVSDVLDDAPLRAVLALGGISFVHLSPSANEDKAEPDGCRENFPIVSKGSEEDCQQGYNASSSSPSVFAKGGADGGELAQGYELGAQEQLTAADVVPDCAGASQDGPSQLELD